MSPETQPNPGSDEAVRRGCLCPVLDNARGLGIYRDGKEFWIDHGCPLHGGVAGEGGSAVSEPTRDDTAEALRVLRRQRDSLLSDMDALRTMHGVPYFVARFAELAVAKCRELGALSAGYEEPKP